jgi:GTP:adenosylcobinamide-phosphate guanylyltransferase
MGIKNNSTPIVKMTGDIYCVKNRVIPNILNKYSIINRLESINQTTFLD